MNLRYLRSRLTLALRRYRLAWRFATRRLTEEEASSIRWECQDIEGRWPLDTIDATCLADDFRECFGDHPELKRLAYDAANRVYRKWDGNEDGAAREWAFDLIREYAKEEGVTFPDPEQLLEQA